MKAVLDAEEKKVSITRGERDLTFKVSEPQVIARVLRDGRVEYRGRPITHSELCEAIEVWLRFRGDITF